jgi:hypothetical protein
VAGCGNHARAGAGQNEQERAQRLGKQALPLQGRVIKPMDPPGIPRKTPAGRRLRAALPAVPLLKRDAQLDQSNLPGTRASSSTR